MRTNEYILYDNIDTPIIKAFHSIISPIKRTYNAHHHTECELSLFIEGHGIYSASQKIMSSIQVMFFYLEATKNIALPKFMKKQTY